MQKSNKKKQNHTSHIALHTAQKGITLIALIITIIVMLILVGVTINVALNGGLFQKAEQAKTQTQKETDQEELQLAVVAALNDDLEIPDANAIKNNLTEGWTITGPENGVYTCISPKLNEFTVNETDKKITYAGISDGKTEAPKFYGVPYRLDSDDVSNLYFFRDGIVLLAYENEPDEFFAVKYIKNENEIILSTSPDQTAILSEDCNTITINGIVALTKNESAAINWDREYAPVFTSIIGNDGSKTTTLSNTSFQEKGEYKTTIIIEDGKYSVTECTITFTLTGASSNREYIQGEDYSYNSSTGEIVIFNLTEPVTMDITCY